ncbi:hypothetical protein MKX01_005082, partial [Papaver californicum]
MDLRSLSCSGEDRISDLPESLIHHILSFIDIKYAVQTCVLSKRWSEIWISLQFLNFNITSFICKGELVDDYSLGNLSSLVTADITMSLISDEDETANSYLGLSEEQNDIYGKRMMEFIGAIGSVKYLKLSSGFLE